MADTTRTLHEYEQIRQLKYRYLWRDAQAAHDQWSRTVHAQLAFLNTQSSVIPLRVLARRQPLGEIDDIKPAPPLRDGGVRKAASPRSRSAGQYPAADRPGRQGLPVQSESARLQRVD